MSLTNDDSIPELTNIVPTTLFPQTFSFIDQISFRVKNSPWLLRFPLSNFVSSRLVCQSDRDFRIPAQQVFGTNLDENTGWRYARVRDRALVAHLAADSRPDNQLCIEEGPPPPDVCAGTYVHDSRMISKDKRFPQWRYL